MKKVGIQNTKVKLKEAISPTTIASSLDEIWSPCIIDEIDDSYVKVAKIKGEFVWHSHENEDELFFVLSGSMVVEYENSKLELNKGDLHVVPKGVKHKPVAENECLILLIEKKQTLHTGDLQTKITKNIYKQLRSPTY